MTLELTGKSRAELEELKASVERALRRAASEDRKAALRAARAAAQEYGFDLDELMADESLLEKAKGKSTALKNPPKYRSPTDPAKTWSGRGRKPQWVLDIEAAGGSIADYLI